MFFLGERLAFFAERAFFDAAFFLAGLVVVAFFLRAAFFLDALFFPTAAAFLVAAFFRAAFFFEAAGFFREPAAFELLRSVDSGPTSLSEGLVELRHVEDAVAVGVDEVDQALNFGAGSIIQTLT